MKVYKLFFSLFVCVFLAGMGFASNIKMVTYFPVPYVSYEGLTVSKVCSVGLINSCSLQAGNQLAIQKLELRSGHLHLNKNVSGNKLTTYTATASTDNVFIDNGDGGLDVKPGQPGGDTHTGGLGNKPGKPSGDTHTGGLDVKPGTVTGLLEFGGVTIQEFKSIIQSIETVGQATANGNVVLGKYYFPACDSMEISWKNLTRGEESGVFLVCGD